jgi:hypothetical protein
MLYELKTFEKILDKDNPGNIAFITNTNRMSRIVNALGFQKRNMFR